MRDPDRIRRILRLLEIYWTAHPGLRLAQIIGNLSGLKDPYHWEDDQLEVQLIEEIRKL